MFKELAAVKTPVKYSAPPVTAACVESVRSTEAATMGRTYVHLSALEPHVPLQPLRRGNVGVACGQDWVNAPSSKSNAPPPK
jgi:hypothetical protein